MLQPIVQGEASTRRILGKPMERNCQRKCGEKVAGEPAREETSHGVVTPFAIDPSAITASAIILADRLSSKGESHDPPALRSGRIAARHGKAVLPRLVRHRGLLSIAQSCGRDSAASVPAYGAPGSAVGGTCDGKRKSPSHRQFTAVRVRAGRLPGGAALLPCTPLIRAQSPRGDRADHISGLPTIHPSGLVDRRTTALNFMEACFTGAIRLEWGVRLFSTAIPSHQPDAATRPVCDSTTN
jgi:hypothetical protein